MSLDPHCLDPQGRGARGHEIKAVGPFSAVFPADARDELYLHTCSQAPSHADGHTLTAHLPSPPAAFLVPFLQVDVLSSPDLCIWVPDFRSSDGVKRERGSNGSMHSNKRGSQRWEIILQSLCRGQLASFCGVPGGESCYLTPKTTSKSPPLACFVPHNKGASLGFRCGEMMAALGGISKARRRQLVKA